jgi:hypothetical protein
MSVLLFLMDSDSSGSMQGSFWHRRSNRFLVSAAVIVFLVVLAFAGIFLFWHSSAEGNLVSFVCTPSSSGQAFIVNARINLADGMNQNEAMEVGSKVFPEISLQAPGGLLQLLSADSVCDEEGIWTVKFTFGSPVPDASRTYSGSEAMRHVLKTVVMTINPFDKTVKYVG